MRLDELCLVIRLNRRTIDHSSSRRIMRVCVYKDGTQTNNPTKQDLDTKSQFKVYYSRFQITFHCNIPNFVAKFGN